MMAQKLLKVAAYRNAALSLTVNLNIQGYVAVLGTTANSVNYIQTFIIGNDISIEATLPYAIDFIIGNDLSVGSVTSQTTIYVDFSLGNGLTATAVSNTTTTFSYGA
jgi:hypothetical protein